MPSSNDTFKYSTLSAWIDSLNTVRKNLSLTQYSDSSAKQGQTAKSSSITNFLSSLNALKSNKYGSYATFTISNSSSVSSGKTIVALDIEGDKIDATLASLKKICGNDITGVSNTSGFSLVGTFVSGFSRASFSRTLVTSNSNFSNDSQFTDNTNFSPDQCSNDSDFSDCSFFTDMSRFSDNYGCDNNTRYGRDTSFSTCNQGGNSNTPDKDCTKFSDSGDCVNHTDCALDNKSSGDSNCYKQSNFSETCPKFSDCSNFSQATGDSNNTNFSPNSGTCDNTCSVGGTINTLTTLFSGFAVKT